MDCPIYPNQSFKFQPIPGFPGQFWVVNQSSGKCAERTGSAGRIDQYTCSTISTQRWTLQGAFNENRYTIRPATLTSSCWDIPYSVLQHGRQIETYVCNETFNQTWYLL